MLGIALFAKPPVNPGGFFHARIVPGFTLLKRRCRRGIFAGCSVYQSTGDRLEFFLSTKSAPCPR